MSLIEGIGDEVPIFFVLAALVVVGFMILAWKSTDVPEPSLSLPANPLTFQVSSRETPVVEEVIPNDNPPISHDLPAEEVQSMPLNVIESHSSNFTPEKGETSGESPETVQEDNTLRRRNPGTSTEENTILIRLKYMDDTQREVISPLTTTLGEFKRMHFQTEVTGNRVVKLIFNGQVLADDTSTLTQLGLDNNCVVHCLVHQLRSTVTPQEPSVPPVHYLSEDEPILRQQSANEAGIDVSGLLVPLFGVILGLVWYCRITYATHFTAAGTTALVGLSGLCIFSFFIIWYPTVGQEIT